MDELKQLREAITLLDKRLTDYQNHNNKGQDMRHILTQFKRVLRQLEAITPYQYDGLVMQCLGGF
jgi:hypothetical protein